MVICGHRHRFKSLQHFGGGGKVSPSFRHSIHAVRASGSAVPRVMYSLTVCVFKVLFMLLFNVPCRQAGRHWQCVSKKLCPGLRCRQTGRARDVCISFKRFSCKLEMDINADDHRPEHDDSYRPRRCACFVFHSKNVTADSSRAKAVARSQGPSSFGLSPHHVTATPTET